MANPVEYDRFLEEGREVFTRFAQVHGRPPNVTDLYHNAWRRLSDERWSHQRILDDIGIVDPPTPPPTPPVDTPRLRIEGRKLFAGDRRFVLRDCTAFALPYLVSVGRAPEADQWMGDRAAEGFNGVRVLTVATNLFELPDTAGRSALVQVLQMAKRHGLYVRAVAVADSKDRQYDWRAHARVVAQICHEHENAIYEFANEHYHGSQADDIESGDDCQREAESALRGLSVPWMASAATVDEPDEASGTVAKPWGDIVTRHLDRGRDPLNMARRVKQIGEIGEILNVPVLSGEPIGAAEHDEPGRRLANPAIFGLLGAYGAAFNVNSCFHSEAGLQCQPFGPIQKAAACEFITGSKLLPDDQHGDWRFFNANHSGSPIEADESAFEDPSGGPFIRAYSFVRGDTSFTIATHRPDDFPEGHLRWSNGWRRHSVIGTRPQITLFENGR